MQFHPANLMIGLILMVYLISMKTEMNMLVQEMGSIWILQPVIMLENMEWLDIFFKLIIATDYLLLFLSF